MYSQEQQIGLVQEEMEAQERESYPGLYATSLHSSRALLALTVSL